MDCEHRSEWIRERNHEKYCAVCRKIIYEEPLIESSGQGRNNINQYNGWRRVGSSRSKSIE